MSTEPEIQTYCCDTMKRWSQPCEQHRDDPMDCPDRLIHHTSANVPGIRLFDGGSAFVVINFCPWCGQQVDDSGLGSRRFADGMKAGLAKATELLDVSADTIRLYAGEMSAQEMRSVRAVLRWKKTEIENLTE